MMLNDGASSVSKAFFLVAKFLVHDVILESRLLHWHPLAISLEQGCAWNLPLLVRVVYFENLLGCWSPRELIGLLNGILNILDFGWFIALVI
jgi:hypothetical protein